MKKITVALICVLSLLGGRVNAQGIAFKSLAFEDALAEAQKSDKLIFIDFYTDWCGPCKMLAKSVFPNQEVGQLFNREFINLKLNAEKEGRATAKKYKVNAYPTLLFINGDGEMISKGVGGKDVEGLITLAKSALEAKDSGLSIAELKEAFENKKNDEHFLKLYIDKMIQNRENPTEGIEAWLKVQTQIKEDDVDMFEFFLKHAKYMLVDGKAEEILKTNYDEFFDIATRREEVMLKKMFTRMVSNTKVAAYSKQNPELMRAFVTNWKELEGNNIDATVLKEFEMDCLMFSNDAEGYKKMAVSYIDSIMSAKSLERIKQEDQAFYEDYKTNTYKPSLLGNAVLKNLEKGREALAQTKAIEKTGFNYLKYCTSKKDFKRLHTWIDYGEKLVPDEYRMDNLRATVYNKQGKLKKAIHYKELAVNKLPENDKSRGVLQRQLDKMKNKQQN
ncbi:thioredoxin family protein [Carboxylicivirga taeanensis]|uniref:thioredoxin family protein n=1 Tax=Carboxylicivirga taeanensis TaxID=1416875 RepID=UPI003F6DF58C